MKLVLLALCGLVACSATDPEPLPEPPPIAVPRRDPPSLAPGLERLTEQYESASLREGALVTTPGATPEFIDRLHAADLEARRRIAVLTREGQHASAASISAAQSAVRVLLAVLQADPKAIGDHGGSP